MTTSQVVQLGEQILDFHGLGGKDPPGRGGPSRLPGGQTTIDGLPDHRGDGGSALTGQGVHAFVALIVQEDL